MRLSGSWPHHQGDYSWRRRLAWTALAATLFATSSRLPADDATPAAPTAYVVMLDGLAADVMVTDLRDALAALPEHAPVVVDVHLRGGQPDAAVKMLDLLAARRAHGPVIEYASQAVGPGVLLLAAADRIYAPANAILGPGVTPDEAASPSGALPLSTDELQNLAAPAPHRVELIRAFFENGLRLVIGNTTVKSPGVLLSLKGADAARALGDPPGPLLVDALEPGLGAALKDYFPGGAFSALAWADKSFSPEPAAALAAQAAPEKSPAPNAASRAPVSVYIVPIHGEIDTPQLYILRRALKDAITNNADAVIIDMDTLGGEMGVTLDMMDALAKFPGHTYTYVNDKATSAGSYIAVATDDIYFSPTGTIGAAEVVDSSGGDIDSTMKRKIDSFMRSRVRAITGAERYRADVQRAMMDPDFELKIGDKVLKPSGELLSLTAKEACETYGDPPETLLGAGIAPSRDDLLDQLYGPGGYQIKEFQPTWSETLAQWLNAVTPILIGAGIFLLVLEFKTPGFGLPGILGLTLLLIVLASQYVAGLSGYEPIALFVLGIILLLLEVLVFTHSLICGLLGGLCFFASFIWAMTDVWPGQSASTNFSIDALTQPFINLGLALLLAWAAFAVAVRFLPKTWVYHRLVNEASVPPESLVAASGGAAATGATALPSPGTRGLAMTDLRPLGEVEIAGGRFQARAVHGHIARGATVEVIGRKDFALAVKAAGAA